MPARFSSAGIVSRMMGLPAEGRRCRVGVEPSLARTVAAEERVDEPIGSEINVDAIDVNLSAGDEGPQQTEGLFLAFCVDSPDDVGCGRDRALDVWRAAASRRQCRGDGVGIGKKGFEALDDQPLEFGRRKALPRSRFAFVP